MRAPEPVATSAAPSQTWWRLLAVAMLVGAYDSLTALGWSMSVRSFVALRRGAHLVAGVLVVAMAKFIGTAIAGLTGALSPATADALLIALVAYSAVGAISRDVFTRRRDIVAGSAQIPLFRALDIPAWAVFLTRVAGPAVRTTGWTAAGVTGLWLGLGPLPGGTLVPALIWLIALLGLRLAVTAAQAAGRQAGRFRWSLLVLCCALGFAGGRLVSPVLTHRATGPELTSAAGTLAAGIGNPALAAGACLLALVLAAASYRRLLARSFRISPEGRPDRRALRAVGEVRWTWVGLCRWAWHSSARRVAVRACSCALVIAVATAGIGAPIRNLTADANAQVIVLRVLVIIGLLVALAIGEALATHLGVGVLRHQFRAQWEWGGRAGRTAVSHVAFWQLGGVAAAAVLGILLTGFGPTLSPTHLLFPLCVVSATAVADAAAPGRRQPDGSSSPTLLSGLIAVGLSVPCLMVALMFPELLAVSALALIWFILIGGTWWLVTYRILGRPLALSAR